MGGGRERVNPTVIMKVMKFNPKSYVVLMILIIITALSIRAFAIAPSDENFDDDYALSESGAQFVNDGIKYTVGGTLIGTFVTNDDTSPLGDGDTDYYMNVGTDASLKIEASDSSSFRLKSFDIDALADTNILITPSSGTAVTLVSNNSWVTQTVDLSVNTDFQNITSITITGSNMILCIDNLDFEAAVLPSYSVTYNGNTNTGGSVPTDASTYTNGETVTVFGNQGSLYKTGYTFAGWNTAANGSGTSYSGGDSFTMGSGNVTLYAQWAPVDYSVTYNGNTNTGGSVPSDGNTYHITDTVTVLGNTGSLVKTNYTFTGWNTASNGSGTDYNGGDTFAMGSSNVTLYAQWTENTYTVTYNGNTNTGGAVPTDGTVYYNGDTVTVHGNTGALVKIGYRFEGWNTAANGSGTSFSGGDTFSIATGNVTLYAQWSAVDYSVTYDGNTNTSGSVPIDGNTYNITNTVTVLGNTGSLFKTGYNFTGWNTAANGSGTDYNGGDTFAMGSRNVTLYAQWTAITYSVTYNGNNNTGGAVPTDGTSYTNGDTATVLGNTGSLVRTGYTFAGWNTAANGSGTSYTGGDTFSISASSVTLYAQWTAVDYMVTYDGNTNTGGSIPIDGNTYNITNTVTVLGNTGSLVKTGYNFDGWNTAANGSGTDYSGGDTFAMGSSNVTLYAQWRLITYSVTYSGNNNTGGSAPTDGTDYTNGDTATVFGNTGSLVRSGYTFSGWNTAANGSGTSYTGGDTFGITTSNVNLYAQWTPVDYSVIYNGNTNTGGSVPTDGNTYNIADTVTVLGNTGTLVKTGFTFTGWNTAANGSGTDYSGGDTFAMGSSNVTLYAQWTEITYTVTYNGNNYTEGDVPTDGTTYRNGDTATVLGNTGGLVKAGCTFAGWNTAANGSGTGYDGGDTFGITTSNVTLYAQWTAVDYTVTYDGNTNTGGSVPIDGNTYNITDTVTVPGNTGTLVKTGYTFAGWNTAADGSGTGYTEGDTFAMGSSNVTLYAQWTENAYIPDDGSDRTSGVPVYIDGMRFMSGESETTTEDGRTMTTVTIRTGMLEKLLRSEDNGVRVMIPVPGSTDSFEGVLDGRMVRNMEDKEAVFEIRTESSSYRFPASGLNIGAIAEYFGDDIELRDIKVAVTIAKPTDDMAMVIENAANNGGFVLMAEAVEFSVTFTYGDETLTLERFGTYAERTILIPEGIDLYKVSTAVIVAPDGTLRHVPTKISIINGKYYAVISSLTNSVYALISNPVELHDTKGHWAESEINDMASRKILYADIDGDFQPDSGISRAEFTALIVRALGLPESNKTMTFGDVDESNVYRGAIQTAFDYGIIIGYPDNRFGPNDRLTREQALTMIVRAMAITGLDGRVSTEGISLDAFSDYIDVSAYAREATETCISMGIIIGRDDNTLAPKAYITKAEAAVIVRRLLLKSELF